MKKILTLIVSFLTILIVGITAIINNEEKGELKSVKVAEVTHSIFYAPQYLAHSLGFFEDEGLDVEIILTSGADAVAAAVMSGDVEIGFCGTEQTVYIYNQGAEDYLVSFSALTKKDGSFIVSRNKEENFDVSNLKGKYLIAGRVAGMPAMTLEWALNQNNVETSELEFDTSIAFAAMSGAFIGGTGDYVTLFEPTALQLEKQGIGYVVASVGELGGVVPYTAYNSKLSYIENNPDVIEGFTKAIDRALVYVSEHSSEDIAKHITEYFPDVSYNDIVTIVERYKNIDAWYESSFISEEDFNHIQEIIDNAIELDKFAPYDKLIDTTYMKK